MLCYLFLQFKHLRVSIPKTAVIPLNSANFKFGQKSDNFPLFYGGSFTSTAVNNVIYSIHFIKSLHPSNPSGSHYGFQISKSQLPLRAIYSLYRLTFFIVLYVSTTSTIFYPRNYGHRATAYGNKQAPQAMEH